MTLDCHTTEIGTVTNSAKRGGSESVDPAEVVQPRTESPKQLRQAQGTRSAPAGRSALFDDCPRCGRYVAGVLGHLKKDGLKPEIFYHPDHRNGAIDRQKREAEYAVRCIAGVMGTVRP